MTMVPVAQLSNMNLCKGAGPHMLGPRVVAPRRAVRVSAQQTLVNPSIKKDEAKVVDTVSPSDLEKPQTSYCRCWRSGTFPLCDGSHVKYNKESGDNVGPLLVKKA
ncbi:hypothetical protein ACKKBG_A30610 [Auxenochlorella protothecoides x Auxenochlorella symbiontica]